jgi:WD40 repeat protein
MTRIASGSQDGTIRIWSTDTWECERVLKGHQGLIKALVCDGQYVYSGATDNTLRIWTADTLQPVTVLPAQGEMQLQVLDWWGGISQIAVDDSRFFVGQGNGIIAI